MPATVGTYLRTWRQQRRLSQLHLALDAEISQRHLSFIESGRAAPSRDMLLRLAERLEVPLRDRNAMLLSAGFAPVYSEMSLEERGMATVRSAIERVLAAHEPFPALAVDRHWNLVLANSALAPLLQAVSDTTLLEPPVNVLRVSLHPRGLAPHIVNLPEWKAHLLDRLRRQVALTADTTLETLLRELAQYPAGSLAHPQVDEEAGRVFVPLMLRTERGVLSFISTTTIFGTPRDVTLSEIAVEAFFPADDETRRQLAAAA
jgi:transcriptional regulator with XRE-family HTH domain